MWHLICWPTARVEELCQDHRGLDPNINRDKFIDERTYSTTCVVAESRVLEGSDYFQSRWWSVSWWSFRVVQTRARNGTVIRDKWLVAAKRLKVDPVKAKVIWSLLNIKNLNVKIVFILCEKHQSNVPGFSPKRKSVGITNPFLFWTYRDFVSDSHYLQLILFAHSHKSEFFSFLLQSQVAFRDCYTMPIIAIRCSNCRGCYCTNFPFNHSLLTVGIWKDKHTRMYFLS